MTTMFTGQATGHTPIEVMDKAFLVAEEYFDTKQVRVSCGRWKRAGDYWTAEFQATTYGKVTK